MRYFYKWSTLRRTFKYLAPLIRLIELPILNKYGSRYPNHPVIYIIGAPRSGSTILYQMMTNLLNISYINNFIDLGRENIFIAFLLNEMIYQNKPHHSFLSKYGRTQKDGLNAPNEGGEFWYRWVPRNLHYISEQMAEKLPYQQIQKNIYAIINKFNRPLLFKNLNLGMRIALLEKMNTHNKYIFIKRNPFYTAQSLLIARRKNNNDIETWWSVKPPGYKYIQSFNPIKQVVRQVYNIEKQITKDLGEYVNPQDVLTVNYEDLIQGNLKLEHLRTFIGSAESKQENSNVQLINGNVSRLEKPVLDQIKHEVEKLDWKGYKSQI